MNLKMKLKKNVVPLSLSISGWFAIEFMLYLMLSFSFLPTVLAEMSWNAQFSFNPVSVRDDRELTKPPAAHVVQLSTEEHSGQDVDHWKDNPENSIPFSKHLVENIKTHLKIVWLTAVTRYLHGEG